MKAFKIEIIVDEAEAKLIKDWSARVDQSQISRVVLGRLFNSLINGQFKTLDEVDYWS